MTALGGTGKARQRGLWRIATSVRRPSALPPDWSNRQPGTCAAGCRVNRAVRAAGSTEAGKHMVTRRVGGRNRSAVSVEHVVAAARVAGVLVTAYRIHVSLRRLEALAQEKQRRDTLTEYRRDHQRLIGRATEDPSLLPVLDAYEGDLHPDTQRRHLFANDLYQHAYQGYQLGVLSLADLHGHLRYIFQSRAMRQYWEATRHHRASLVADSEEAELGRIVDALVVALDDAEADGEDWWVVGYAPERRS
ncbi:DUF6082 family protein [Streptomyces phaeochromogenes]